MVPTQAAVREVHALLELQGEVVYEPQEARLRHDERESNCDSTGWPFGPWPEASPLTPDPRESVTIAFLGYAAQAMAARRLPTRTRCFRS